jgi:hypothetical protein
MVVGRVSSFLFTFSGATSAILLPPGLNAFYYNPNIEVRPNSAQWQESWALVFLWLDGLFLHKPNTNETPEEQPVLALG